MGTKLAPALATIYLALLEEAYLETAPLTPHLYLRYIDDIFLIWSHGRDTLDTFIAGLNQLKPRIKFTAEISDCSMTFLDVTVYKGPRFAATGLLDTDIHYKPTNNFLYVHGSSHHPPHTFKAVALGECLRILRNVSEEKKFDEHKGNLIRKLKLRAFPRSALMAAREVTFDDRQRILAGEPFTEKRKEISEFFVTTKFDHVRPSLAKTLHKHWLAIESDPQLFSRFKIPPMVSYTRSRSLKTTIKNKKFACPNLISPFPVPPSPFLHTLLQPQTCLQACTSKRCLVCPRLLRHAVVRSRNDSIFPIDTSITCTTTGIVYVLTCEHCRKQYVGQSGYSMRSRFSRHKYAFTRIHKSLYHHFTKIHKSTFDVRITLVERVEQEQQRLATENWWIDKLDTFLPHGLNTRTSLYNISN